MTDPEIPWGMINLDFDSENRLMGIEVLPASYFPTVVTGTHSARTTAPENEIPSCELFG
jgi:hypothetical protein